MNRKESDWIVIKGLREGDRSLAIPEPNTVEGARSEIDNFNAGSFEDGGSPRKFLICCRERYEYYDDSGVFIRSEEVTSVIEKYPSD